MRQLFLNLFSTCKASGGQPRGGLVADETLTRQAAEWLAEVSAAQLSRQVQVFWNSRLSTTAGQAYYGNARVFLNPKLRDVGEGEIDRTLRHEVAHLLAHHRAGRRRIAPHGPEWRQACLDLGLKEETRCHSLPWARRSVRRKYLYRCTHCQTALERVRPFRKKVACLQCCKTFNAGLFSEKYLLQLACRIPPPG